MPGAAGAEELGGKADKHHGECTAHADPPECRIHHRFVSVLKEPEDILVMETQPAWEGKTKGKKVGTLGAQEAFKQEGRERELPSFCTNCSEDSPVSPQSIADDHQHRILAGPVQLPCSISHSTDFQQQSHKDAL